MAIKEGAVLRPWQAEDIKDERDKIATMLKEHGDRIHDKGAVIGRIKRMDQQLDRYAPEPLSGEEKDKAAKEVKELDTFIAEGMQSHDERMKCPVDAPYYLRQWENAKHPVWGTRKKAIMRRKALMYQLHPDEVDNRDMGNVERLAPRGGVQGYRADAAISGNMGYQNVPQENWDQAFNPANKVESALDQAKRAAAEREGHEKTNGNGKKKRTLTPEERAAIGQRLKAGKAAKRQPAEAAAV